MLLFLSIKHLSTKTPLSPFASPILHQMSSRPFPSSLPFTYFVLSSLRIVPDAELKYSTLVISRPEKGISTCRFLYQMKKVTCVICFMSFSNPRCCLIHSISYFYWVWKNFYVPPMNATNNCSVKIVSCFCVSMTFSSPIRLTMCVL